MNRIISSSLMVGLAVGLAGCAGTGSMDQVLASKNQIALRSYQSRTYDTNDKIRVLRAVMSTLQDLGFVIDKADEVIGVVSATKLDRYRLSMTISVRPTGQQMQVRANAQIGITAMEEPEPYQDFFASLDKGLFLDNNLLVDRVPTQNSSAVTSTASVAGIGEDSFEYYGQAEKEISSGTYDANLWAGALVEVEGDEQKRKAKYIQLRAEQLHYQNTGATAARQQTSTAAKSISAVATNFNFNSNFTGTYMTEEELLNTFPNSTVAGISNVDGVTPWTQIYYARKKGNTMGKIKGVFGGKSYKSWWTIKNGKWCEDWGEGWKCNYMERVDEIHIAIYKNGKPLKNLYQIQ